MQSGVFAFVVIDVNGDFLHQVHRLAVGGLEAFEVGPDDVVVFAGRNALGELAVVVGIHLPLGLLVFGAADFYFDPVDGTIVRSPDRAHDQGVGFVFVPVFRLGGGMER